MATQNKDDKKSFWTTMPGILTGIAAIITALTGLFLALNQQPNKPEPKPVFTKTDTTQPKPSPDFKYEKVRWEQVASDDFSKIGPGWPKGWPTVKDDNSNKRYKIHRSMIDGKYRIDINYFVDRSVYTYAPYASAITIDVSVKLEFMSSNNTYAAAGILFGYLNKNNYQFKINTEGNFFLTYFDYAKNKHKTLVSSRPANVKINEPIKLQVTVINNVISLYINGKSKAEIKDPNYNGGTTGLVLYGDANSRVVVDFDNFEFKHGTVL